MIALALQSGSNGNCYYVEHRGVGLLIDAGISGRKVEQRLQAIGRDPRRAAGLLITHNHSDHIKSAGIFQRKFRLDVCASESTLQAGRGRLHTAPDAKMTGFLPGETIDIGPLAIDTYPTPHDAPGAVAVVIEAGGKRLGIFTDLGCTYETLAEEIASCHALFIESNYDPDMLRNGPYPPHLQARIRGRGGHIANAETARLLDDAGRHLAWACLAHLSEKNNDPALALATSRDQLGDAIDLHLAGRYEATPVFELG